jgi:hypothetical protein
MTTTRRGHGKFIRLSAVEPLSLLPALKVCSF